MGAPAAVGVNNDLAPGQAGVTMRSPNYETACRQHSQQSEG